MLRERGERGVRGESGEGRWRGGEGGRKGRVSGEGEGDDGEISKICGFSINFSFTRDERSHRLANK